MQVIVDLPNFPDWAIPMVSIVPVFKTLDVYDLSDPLISITSNYFYDWVKVNDTDYQLIINIEGSAKLSGNDIPLFLDLDFVFVNKNNIYPVQSEQE